MNSMLHAPLSEFSLEARTDDAGANHTPYTVKLAIAEQPVKSSRKALHRVSVELTCDGRAVRDADVAVEFHPLHAPRAQPIYSLSELVLAPQHRAENAGQFDGAVALQAGDYRVDVTINHESHAGFVIHM
ncbi:MAG: hypothetical protein JWQ90_2004 [Hydrocarboniphaga sp.]|uniref:hypothetical protein n=1 Tax=Hydrocarboniphaga sp. TaxID=2033016 RepID=UPI002622B0D6|nr:hypothetical protein [Hydrocarboniphaga sp.]MDB5969554.1 hypothetical protein [Hydrocarboniphaga sp.]